MLFKSHFVSTFEFCFKLLLFKVKLCKVISKSERNLLICHDNNSTWLYSLNFRYLMFTQRVIH